MSTKKTFGEWCGLLSVSVALIHWSGTVILRDLGWPVPDTMGIIGLLFWLTWYGLVVYGTLAIPYSIYLFLSEQKFSKNGKNTDE